MPCPFKDVFSSVGSIFKLWEGGGGRGIFFRYIYNVRELVQENLTLCSDSRWISVYYLPYFKLFLNWRKPTEAPPTIYCNLKTADANKNTIAISRI